MNFLSKKVVIIIGLIVIVVSGLLVSQKIVGRFNPSLKLVPETATKLVGEPIDVIISMNTQSYDISFVDLNLSYDKNLISLNSFTPSANFNTDVLHSSPNNETGIYRIVLGNNSRNKVTGENIEIGILHFSGNLPGIAVVSLIPKEITIRTDPPSDVTVKETKATLTITKP